MITVAGRVFIKPELRAKAVAAATRMVQATQKESGCLQYHFYADLEDENILHVFEEWDTQEALDAHFNTPHMAEFAESLPEILAAEPKIMRYAVSEVTRLT